MSFSPSREVHDRMLFELAGVFIDRAFNPPPFLWLVAKLPMNLIREIREGAMERVGGGGQTVNA